MRPILRLAASLALACALSAPAAAQGLTWSDVTATPVTVDTLGRVTISGSALTVLFAPIEVSLQSPSDALSATRVVAFEAEVDGLSAPTALRFVQDVRGEVRKDADARVVIVLNLGTMVEVREYPYGRRLESPIVRRLAGRATWRPGQRWQGRIVVMVERRRPDAVALVSIDSFDATVERAR